MVRLLHITLLRKPLFTGSLSDYYTQYLAMDLEKVDPQLSNIDYPSRRISSPDLCVSVPGGDTLGKSSFPLVPVRLGNVIPLSNL